jgi:enoyl-CoA hydratase/carnithine racemase
MTQGFHVEVADGIAVLTIDRPKANAIDAATSYAMGEVFLRFEHDPTVRVAIVTGAGERFFSAGWDLGAAADGEEYDADYGAGGFGGFPDLPGRRTPVIAAVNGMAVGGGFEIAMAADMIVAAEHAQFFLPEAGIGILPDAGSVRLPRLLPPHIARELLLTGRRMGAQEAAQHGLVNRVVPMRRTARQRPRAGGRRGGQCSAEHRRHVGHRPPHRAHGPHRGDERDQAVRELPHGHRFRGRRRRQPVVHREAPARLEGPLTTPVMETLAKSVHPASGC